jgi:septal ring factor EnvC (AmiA/AmiB activator)
MSSVRNAAALTAAVTALLTVAAMAADIIPADPKSRMLMEVVSTLERDLEHLGKKRRVLAKSKDALETEVAINQESLLAVDSELDSSLAKLQRLTRSIVRMREPDDLLLLFSSMRYHDLQVYRRVVSKMALSVSQQLAVLATSRKTLARRQESLLKEQKILSEQREAMAAEVADVEKTLDRKRKELHERLDRIAAVESLFMPTSASPPEVAGATPVPPATVPLVNLGDFKNKKELQIPISPGRVIKAFDRTPQPPMGTEKMARGWILVPFFKGKKKEAKETGFVRAPAPGIVAFVGDVPGFGYTLIIDHGFGYFTVYSNLQKIVPLKGESVKDDQLIATVHSTSPAAEPPYLYFEMRENRAAVDPRPWFKLRAVEPGEGPQQ